MLCTYVCHFVVYYLVYVWLVAGWSGLFGIPFVASFLKWPRVPTDKTTSRIYFFSPIFPTAATSRKKSLKFLKMKIS